MCWVCKLRTPVLERVGLSGGASKNEGLFYSNPGGKLASCTGYTAFQQKTNTEKRKRRGKQFLLMSMVQCTRPSEDYGHVSKDL